MISKFKVQDKDVQKVHRWVIKHYGKANHCENNPNHKGGRQGFQWANIGHTYRCNKVEWVQLCRLCHWELDHPEGRVPIKTKSGKNNESIMVSFRLPNNIVAQIREISGGNMATSNYCRQVIISYMKNEKRITPPKLGAL